MDKTYDTRQLAAAESAITLHAKLAAVYLALSIACSNNTSSSRSSMQQRHAAVTAMEACMHHHAPSHQQQAVATFCIQNSMCFVSVFDWMSRQESHTLYEAPCKQCLVFNYEKFVYAWPLTLHTGLGPWFSCTGINTAHSAAALHLLSPCSAAIFCLVSFLGL